MTKADLYSQITNRIIASLEAGVRPWIQPWRSANMTGRIALPRRHTGEPYTGINVLLLWSEAIAKGYTSPMWMTYKQAGEAGGQVRRGERGTAIVYAGRILRTETDDASGEAVERAIPFLKSYAVFNVEQIDGLSDRFRPQPEPASNPMERIAEAEAFFANTGSIIHHGGSSAFYQPARDFIQMPPFESFTDAAAWTATLAHEHIHWTAPRVQRDLSRYSRDRSERAREELVAEIGSAFLCADLGIVPELEPRPDHASYIQSWLGVLRGDKRAIFQAASAAQRAVAHLHSLQPATTSLAA